MTDAIERLVAELGDAVSTDPATLARHARDTWVLAELHDLEGQAPAGPRAVVEPRTTAEASAAIRLLRELGTPIVPFGGGSGVCGGIEPGRDAVVLSTARMEGLVAIDDTDLLATFRAGTNGMAAERRVQQDGLTIGNWPQSIELSTVGGWVATRASGQFSTAYGSTEDLVHDLEAVLPDGRVVRTRRTPRASAGPDLRQLFLGSEGTLGLVTEVTFSLRPLPAAARGQAFHFESLVAGIEPLRLLMREGWRPPVVRLYDARESKRSFEPWCPEGRAFCIFWHEGPETAVAAESEGVARICEAAGGVASEPAAVDHWMADRNHVPGFRGFLERGIILDTIEVAAPWSRIGELYERVTSSLRELPEVRAASAHSSHSYRSGTNLYFTFAARPDDPSRMGPLYTECWRRTMEATLAAGGGIAHHHGIGRVRRDFLRRELGDEGLALLRQLKASLDPAGLWNPGTLLPGSDV